MAEEQKQAAAPVSAIKEYAPNSEEKTMAWLSYLGLLFLIPLLAKKDSQYVQFHAKQGMVLFGADIALWIVWWIIQSILFSSWWAIINLYWLITLISFAVWAAIFVISLMGIIFSAQGKWWRLPFGMDKIAAALKF